MISPSLDATLADTYINLTHHIFIYRHRKLVTHFQSRSNFYMPNFEMIAVMCFICMRKLNTHTLYCISLADLIRCTFDIERALKVLNERLRRLMLCLTVQSKRRRVLLLRWGMLRQWRGEQIGLEVCPYILLWCTYSSFINTVDWFVLFDT